MGMVCAGGLCAVEVGQNHGHGVYRWSLCYGGGPGPWAPVCKGGLLPAEVGRDSTMANPQFEGDSLLYVCGSGVWCRDLQCRGLGD